MAQAMLARAPTGSVVSFMLPNWHEAAVIYMARDLGRHGGQSDSAVAARSRAALHPEGCRHAPDVRAGDACASQDYAAMMSRVVAQLETPPEVVVVRGDAGGPHCPMTRCSRTPELIEPCPSSIPMRSAWCCTPPGTTGRPKGVLHSHNSIHALIRQLREHWLVERGDKFPGALADRAYRRLDLRLRMSAAARHDGRAHGTVGRGRCGACCMSAKAARTWPARRLSWSRCLAAARARGHASAPAQSFRLRRRLGAAVADPQGGGIFRARRRDARLRLDRSAGHHGRRRRSARTRRMPPIPTAAPAWPRSSWSGHSGASRQRRRDLRPRAADAGGLSACRG